MKKTTLAPLVLLALPFFVNALIDLDIKTSCAVAHPNDQDCDTVPDDIDAFPQDPTESVDTDGDRLGNNADIDDDNDGVNDEVDIFPLDASESLDTDGDGIGNNADTDDDGDGVLDTADAYPKDASKSVRPASMGGSMSGLWLLLLPAVRFFSNVRGKKARV